MQARVSPRQQAGKALQEINAALRLTNGAITMLHCHAYGTVRAALRGKLTADEL
jgi:hypothetical protein